MVESDRLTVPKSLLARDRGAVIHRKGNAIATALLYLIHAGIRKTDCLRDAGGQGHERSDPDATGNFSKWNLDGADLLA